MGISKLRAREDHALQLRRTDVHQMEDPHLIERQTVNQRQIGQIGQHLRTHLIGRHLPVHQIDRRDLDRWDHLVLLVQVAQEEVEDDKI